LSDFDGIIERVATILLGEPNLRLSKPGNPRWGGQGALSVNLQKSTWFDNAEGKGGGVIDLVVREKGLRPPEAREWLIQQGFALPEGGKPAGGAARGRKAAPKKSAPPPERDEPTVPATRGESVPLGLPPGASNVATFDYVDESGRLIFQTCRFEWIDEQGQRGKTFRQRRPAENGAWLWTTKGVQQVPYRLPELIEAVAADNIIFITEGEKAAESIRAWGVPATTNAGGAGKFAPDLVPYFAGARVVILPDNDEPGRRHRNLIANSLYGVAASIVVLDLPGLPNKGDVFDWKAAGGTVERLYELAETAGRPWSPDSGFESQFNAIPFHELDLPGPEHSWLIKPLITAGERGMLAGPSGSGKSFVAIHMGMTIAQGIPFFGHKSRRGLVIYQAGEGGRGVKKRLRAYRQFNAIDPAAKIPFVLLPKAIDLFAGDDQVDAMIDEIRHWARQYTVPLALVIIDTLSAASPGANENASEDVGPILARAGRIAEACDCAVLLVHHMNAEGSKPRGHTSIRANLETVLVCRKLENRLDSDNRVIRELQVDKQKDGEDGFRLEFVLPAIEIGKDEDGDAITSCIVTTPFVDTAAAEEKAERPRKPPKLTPQCEIYLRAIHAALIDHGEAPPPSLGLPASITRVVKGAHVRVAFSRSTFEGDDDDPVKREEKIKRAIARHGETLMQLNIIGRERPYVWLSGVKPHRFRGPEAKQMQPSTVLPEAVPDGPATRDDFLPF
jgi:hypothetical protein